MLKKILGTLLGVSLALALNMRVPQVEAQGTIERSASNIFNGTFTGVSKFADGTAAAPSITFTADTNTGFYRSGGDAMGVSVGGNNRFRWNTTGYGLGSGMTLCWASGVDPVADGCDTTLSRSAAGVLKIAGTSGTAEDLTIDFNTSNVIALASTTGATTIQFALGGLDIGQSVTAGGSLRAGSAGFVGWNGRALTYSPADGKIKWNNNADTTNVCLDFSTDAVLSLFDGDCSGAAKFQSTNGFQIIGRGAFQSYASSAVITDGSNIFPLMYRKYIVANTGAGAPAFSESGEVYTNTGDTDGSTVVLGDNPTIGSFYTVAVTAAQTITITASAGETLKFGASTCGTSLTSNTVGSAATFLAATNGAGAIWVTIASTGTWTCNA